jgi:hypothetical protein
MTMPLNAVADTPFAVACPGCHGALAVTLGLANSAVCCPLCACGFLVPDPRQPQASSAPPKQREPRPQSPQENAGGGSRSARRDLEIPSREPAADLATAAPQETSAATTTTSALAPDHAGGPPGGGSGLPAASGEYQFRDAGPVVIGSGADAIELRRLTPEEKHARRVRRNLIMLLCGSAILIVITFLFGRSSGKRRRGR